MEEVQLRFTYLMYHCYFVCSSHPRARMPSAGDSAAPCVTPYWSRCYSISQAVLVFERIYFDKYQVSAATGVSCYRPNSLENATGVKDALLAVHCHHPCQLSTCRVNANPHFPGLQVATQFCGLITIVGGTFLLHTTKDIEMTFGDLQRFSKQQNGQLTLRERRGSSALSLDNLAATGNSAAIEADLEASAALNNSAAAAAAGFVSNRKGSTATLRQH